MALNTPTSAVAFRPDITTFEPTTVLDQAAILKHSTISGQILGDAPSMRVAYIADDEAEFVSEGAEIPESEPDLAEIVVYSSKIALLTRLSREQYGQIGTPEQLGAAISRAMTHKSDNAFLAQPAPNPPDVAPVAGLFNQTGVIAKTGIADNLDLLIDLVAEVEANLAHPTVWLMAPATYAALKKMKTLTAGEATVSSNVSLLGAGTEQAVPMLLSIPVEVRPQMATGTGLLIDSSQVLSTVGPLEVAVDHSAYFSSDGVGIRATWRHGHGLPRPERTGKFTLA